MLALIVVMYLALGGVRAFISQPLMTPKVDAMAPQRLLKRNDSRSQKEWVSLN